jgi:N12 class adenine-specific DNA methylase
MFLNSPTTLKKDVESKDDIIEKYEGVLREINSEFRSLMKRNMQLEDKLQMEIFRRNESESQCVGNRKSKRSCSLILISLQD